MSQSPSIRRATVADAAAVDLLIREFYAAFDAGRAAGALRLFLETEAHNQRVRGFYARHGPRADDSIWMSREL